MKENEKILSVEVDADLHARIKIDAAMCRVPMKQWAVEALLFKLENSKFEAPLARKKVDLRYPELGGAERGEPRTPAPPAAALSPVTRADKSMDRSEEAAVISASLAEPRVASAQSAAAHHDDLLARSTLARSRSATILSRLSGVDSGRLRGNSRGNKIEHIEKAQ